jgi:hypothetical protein
MVLAFNVEWILLDERPHEQVTALLLWCLLGVNPVPFIRIMVDALLANNCTVARGKIYWSGWVVIASGQSRCGTEGWMISAMSRRHGSKEYLGIFEWDSLGSNILEEIPLKYSIVSL